MKNTTFEKDLYRWYGKKGKALKKDCSHLRNSIYVLVQKGAKRKESNFENFCEAKAL